jgi:glucosamine--fructose-6-phosphate aminotransferase (isomerizing)
MNKFLEEINDQPGVIESLLSFYGSKSGENLLRSVGKVVEMHPDVPFIFTGMGSSFFVAHAASTLLNNLGLYAAAVNTGELIHYNHSMLTRRIILVCISQSGESFEIKQIFPGLSSNVTCIGIVNDERSTLSLRSEITLPAKAGKEEMTSTKTYVATSLVSFILGWYLSGRWDEDRKKMIENLARGFKAYLNSYDSVISKILRFFGDLKTLQIMARGPSFSTACQSALMFREALRLPASGILGGEFRHGPMEMVKEGFNAIVFSSEGNTLLQTNRMASDIARYGGRVLLITNEKNYEKQDNVLKIFFDEPDEYLFSVAGILPVQLYIDMYAKLKGFEAGSFSRGSKVTEIE